MDSGGRRRHPMKPMSLSPLLLLGLFLLPERWMFNDFRPALLPVALAGTAILLAVDFARSRRPDGSGEQAPFPGSSEAVKAGRKPAALAVFGATLAVYLLLLSGLVVPAHPLTGDEPHYLILCESLLSDGDIDVFDEYANREYLKFYPGELSVHASPGKAGESHLYSWHLPGLSVFLTPFYYLAGKAGRIAARVAGRPGIEREALIFGTRAGMGLLAALLATAFYLCVLAVTGRRGAALAAWALFAFTPPLLFFSHLIYPEVPAALVLLLFYDRIIRVRPGSVAAFALAGAGLGALPFFGIKYLVLSAAAFLLAVVARRRELRASRVRTAAFLAPILVSAAAFLLMHWSLYASLRPSAVYLGGESAATETPFAFFGGAPLEFAARLLGLLLDQRMGLLPYAPLLFLAIPGYVFFRRRSGRPAAMSAAALFGISWVFAALTAYWGGYCPPGRPLLPVVWIPALFMASALAGAAGRRPLATAGLLVMTLLITGQTARRPELLYHENMSRTLRGGEGGSTGTSSQLLGAWSNSLVDLRPLVPALSNEGKNRDWRPAPFWILAGVLLSLAFLSGSRPREQTGRQRHRAFAPPVVWIFSLLALGYVFFDVQIRDGFPVEDGALQVFPQNEAVHRPEPGGIWTRGRRSAVLLLASPRSLPLLRLTVMSPVGGRVFLKAGGTAQTLELTGPEGRAEAVFVSPPGFRFRGRDYYRIRVRAEREFVPARLDRKSVDGRLLGVFLSVAAE